MISLLRPIWDLIWSVKAFYCYWYKVCLFAKNTKNKVGKSLKTLCPIEKSLQNRTSNYLISRQPTFLFRKFKLIQVFLLNFCPTYIFIDVNFPEDEFDCYTPHNFKYLFHFKVIYATFSLQLQQGVYIETKQVLFA